MAELVFNLQGYAFQDGIARIREGYAVAEQAVRADLEKARQDARDYEQALAAGGAWIGERDSDGDVVWSQSDVHELVIDNAATCLMTLRKAYALIAYHHWERSARQWTRKPKARDHDTLAAAVAALGYSVHPDLEVLRDLANALKHNSDRWGDKLLANHPGLLNIQSRSKTLPTDWYEAIDLSHETMIYLFDVVALSGPTGKMLPSGT